MDPGDEIPLGNFYFNSLRLCSTVTHPAGPLESVTPVGLPQKPPSLLIINE